MTKWFKTDQQLPTSGLEKTFKKSGKHRLRDCTRKLAQKWPRNGPKTAKNASDDYRFSTSLLPCPPRFAAPTGSARRAGRPLPARWSVFRVLQRWKTPPPPQSCDLRASHRRGTPRSVGRSLGHPVDRPGGRCEHSVIHKAWISTSLFLFFYPSLLRDLLLFIFILNLFCISWF